MMAATNERRIEIPCHEDVLCLSRSPSGSRYGLLETTPTRGVVETTNKRMQRRKFIIALITIVTVVLTGIGYIMAQHKSTEIVSLERLDNNGGEDGDGTSSSNTVVLLKSRQESLSPARDLMNPGPKDSYSQESVAMKLSDEAAAGGRVNGDNHSQVDKVQEASQATTTEGDVPYYNPNATCVNHVKRGPKTFDEWPDLQKNPKFQTIDEDPISLLYVMLECPTFAYFSCELEERVKPFRGYKVEVEVRSLNETFIAYDKTAKKAKKQAAYFAAKKLYPQASTEGLLPDDESTEKLKHATCSRQNPPR